MEVCLLLIHEVKEWHTLTGIQSLGILNLWWTEEMASIVASNAEAALERLEDCDKPLHVFYTLPFRDVTLVATWLE